MTLTSIGWLLLCLGIAGIISGYHKSTLWSAINNWLNPKPTPKAA